MIYIHMFRGNDSGPLVDMRKISATIELLERDVISAWCLWATRTLTTRNFRLSAASHSGINNVILIPNSSGKGHNSHNEKVIDIERSDIIVECQ